MEVNEIIVVILHGVLVGFIVVLTYQREKALERAQEAEKEAKALRVASIKLINDVTQSVQDQRTIHKYYKDTTIGQDLENAIMHSMIAEEYNKE